MKVQLTVKHGHLNDDIQAKMREKVARLPRFFERTTGVHILVDLQQETSPDVELVVTAEETKDFVASASGNNVIAALDQALGKVEQQLRKHKDKITHHRG